MVLDYYNRFEDLSTKVTSADEAFLQSCFESGLRSDIHREVRVHRLTTLLQAVNLAKMIEDKLNDTSRRSFQPRPFLPTIKPSSALLPSQPPLPPSVKPVILIRWLTTTQMMEQREKGICYNCDEKFHRGHRCKGKMFALLEHLQQIAKKKTSKAIFIVSKSYFLRFS